MTDPLAFTNLSEVEEQKRNQNMAKARMSYYSHNLKLRLQYAKLKVEHGWQRQTLSEVENLYFRHSRRPHPAVNPRKNTFTPQSLSKKLTGSSTSLLASVPPPLASSSASLPLGASGSTASLVRSDTLQTIPDTSDASRTQNSSLSSTLLDSTVNPMDASQSPRYPSTVDFPIPAVQGSSSNATTSSPSSTEASTDASVARHAVVSQFQVHPHPVDPNIDPALLSTPPTLAPSLSMQQPTQIQQQRLQSSPSSSFTPGQSSMGVSMADVLASSALNRTATIPVMNQSQSTSSHSLPAVPTHTNSTLAPPRPLAQSSPVKQSFHRPIQPAPTPPQPASSSAFGSPLTYDSFWSSHQSSYGLKSGSFPRTGASGSTYTPPITASGSAFGTSSTTSFASNSSFGSGTAGAGSGRPVQSS